MVKCKHCGSEKLLFNTNYTYINGYRVKYIVYFCNHCLRQGFDLQSNLRSLCYQAYNRVLKKDFCLCYNNEKEYIKINKSPIIPVKFYGLMISRRNDDLRGYNKRYKIKSKIYVKGAAD